MADFEGLSALLAGMRTPQTPLPAPVTATTPFDKLNTLFAGGDITPMLRSIGGGMANMVETNDPYLAFGRGFGGAQTQASTAAQTAADAAAKAKQAEFENALAMNNALINQETSTARMTQDQSQFDSRMTQDQKQFDERARQDEQDRQIRAAAEQRQQKLDELTIKKTEAEIKRMANSNGITVDQQLQIERIAQAAGEGIISPAERKTAVDAKRQELVSQFSTQGGMNSPNSAAPAVGDIVDGYKFKGGDPNSAESWEAQ
jgi:hypothetical protein